MTRAVFAEIDRQAFSRNMARIRDYCGKASILAMIKSNGYGHGLLRVARHLSQAEALGVATIDEALQLRREGISREIVVMSGFYNSDELRCFQHYQLTAVVHCQEQINLLQRHQLGLRIWLKIDTGMHRLGFQPEAVSAVDYQLRQLSALHYCGFITHLANADAADTTYTLTQIEKFNRVLAALPNQGAKSIANSAALLKFPQSRADWVRPGILLYGVSPIPLLSAKALGFSPVMTLTAKLIASHQLKKGDSVGYGCVWRCPRDMLVGVVAIGYGDGYPRSACFGTPTLINGRLCPLVGRVSMDMITIDLTNYKTAKLGDTVTLWGKSLPIERVAACANTIPYELLCGITQRVTFKEYDQATLTATSIS